MLRSNPGFAAIAILILAVGIGATTAIFSVVNATLLRPLPFREPDRLMSVFLRMPVQYGSGEIDMVWSYPKYQTFLDDAAHVQRRGDSRRRRVHRRRRRRRRARPRRIGERAVLLDPRHHSPSADASSSTARIDRPVAIGRSSSATRYWRERFGGAESALGSMLEVNGKRYTIIGIAPRGLRRHVRERAHLAAVHRGARPVRRCRVRRRISSRWSRA